MSLFDNVVNDGFVACRILKNIQNTEPISFFCYSLSILIVLLVCTAICPVQILFRIHV